jgi:hypothetical protein
VEEGTPSITAMVTAMMRAAHLLWDDPPKIFEDTLALRLSGCESEAALRAQFDRLDGELSADVRKSEKVSLRNPIMPITDDFGG